MIWLRRTIVLPLGLLFFAIFLCTVTATQIISSVSNPNFYTSKLHDNNVYEFITSDLLTAALQDRRVEEQNLGEDTPLISSGITNDQIVYSVNRVIPPEWTQAIVEHALAEFGHYITGKTDNFTITVKAGARVDSLATEVKSLLSQSEAYNLLFDRQLIPKIEDASNNGSFDELPFGLGVSANQLISATRNVVTEQWVKQQANNAIDEVASYWVGNSETFTIKVQFSDRTDLVMNEIKQLLVENDSYDLIYQDLISPMIIGNLGESIKGLPLTVSITSAEVHDILNQAAPPGWMKEQVDRIVDDMGPYIAGQVGSFDTEVSLNESKLKSNTVLVNLIEQKIKEQFDQLPTCMNVTESQQAMLTNPRTLPSCIPGDMDQDDILTKLEVNIPNDVADLILEHIPDTITFSELDLRNLLESSGSGDSSHRLDDARSKLAEGWTYKLDDLKETMLQNDDQYDFNTLQEIRSYFTNPWTYTDTDFSQYLEQKSVSVEMFDSARNLIKVFDSYKWLSYVPAVLLLIQIGLLGGRGWSGRIKWTSGTLFVASSAIFILAKPVYEALSSSIIKTARDEFLSSITADTGAYYNTLQLATTKTFDVGVSMVDTITSAVADTSLTLMIISGVVLVTSMLWSRITGLVR